MKKEILKSFEAVNREGKKVKFSYPCYNDGNTTFLLAEGEVGLATRLRDEQFSKYLLNTFMNSKNTQKFINKNLDQWFDVELKFYKENGYGQGEIKFFQDLYFLNMAAYWIKKNGADKLF